jgi:predicted PurR-regulated permease PerM
MIRHERVSPALPLGRIVAAGTTLIVIYLALRAIAGVPQSLLLAFFGVLLAIVIDVPTTALARRIPRSLALSLVLLAGLGLGAGGIVLVTPSVATQLALLAQAVPRGLAQAGDLWARLAPGQADLWATVRNRVVVALPSLAERLVPFVNGTMSVVTSTLVVIAIALFVAVDPRAELRWMARLVPPRRERVFWELMGRLGHSLRQWLIGMIATLAIVAALTGAGLWAVGVHAWLALALLTFVTGFVPYLGAVFTGLLVLGAGLAASPRTALAAVIVFVVGQVLQGLLIAPICNRHALRMPPGLLLTWQLVMVASFGVLGVLAAQPLLAVAIVVVEYLYVERRLGREAQV